MGPERCIDCGMLLDDDEEIFCTEDESHCRCADCDRDYWNERELTEDDNPADVFTPRNED